jgi:lysophospholipase L1-like esterase
MRNASALLLWIACLLPAGEGGFAGFDRRATAGGERLTVVFFGCSLTWGANASDHPNTSYRAHIRDRLEERYPKAPFRYHDAAIGGTDSILGVYRLERDVLSRKPDLVFVDFTANDGIDNGDAEKSASYEAILRRLAMAGIPTVQVAFPFKSNLNPADLPKFVRLRSNQALAAIYATGWGDAVTAIGALAAAGTINPNDIWAIDAIHPCDPGYKLFADAAWAGFIAALDAKLVPIVPEQMVNAATFMTSNRVHLAKMERLPAGWRPARPNHEASNYDWLMSRWLDDLVIAQNHRPVLDDKGKPVKGEDGKAKSEPVTVDRLRLTVEASNITLFGETNGDSAMFRVWIDGVAVKGRYGQAKDSDLFNANRFGGAKGHLSLEVARGLDPAVAHLVEIEPVFTAGKAQELRFESICVAGGKATAVLAH